MKTRSQLIKKMKPKILILLLLAFALNIKAQDNKGIFKLNLNTSFDARLGNKDIVADRWAIDGVKYDRMNYKIGLNLEYGFKEKLSVLSGLNYSNKDFTGAFRGNEFVLNPPARVELRCIEIPVLLRYYFQPEKLGFYGEIGLNNNIKLSGDKMYIVDFHTYSIGLKVGGGIEFNASSKFALQLFANYNKGLSNVFKNSNYKVDYLSFGIGIAKRL